MTNQGITYFLDNVGYLIVQTSEKIRSVNESYRKFGAYHGVDRKPFFITTDPYILSIIGEPQIDNEDLRISMDEWFAHTEDFTFIVDQDVAFRLDDSFKRLGLGFELLFCQVAWTTIDERDSRMPAVVRDDESSTLQVLGFDTSMPSCNHSAIFQPGVVGNNPEWLSKLNKWGLLDDYFDAVELRDAYLKIYPEPPFHIYLVHRVVRDKQMPL